MTQPLGSTRRRRRTILAGALAAGLAMAGCSAPAAPSTSPSGSAPAVFPLTLQNCGQTITLDAPPKRVVATSLPALEATVAVGAKDSVVGTAGVIKNLSEPYRTQAAGLKEISKGGFPPPSKEAVLSVEPDFVVAGYEFDFNPNALGDRAKLFTGGLQSYLSEGECGEPLMANAVTDITNYGKLFGKQDRAAELVAEMQKQIDTAPTPPKGLRILRIIGDPAKPTRSSHGVGDDMIKRLGGEVVLSSTDSMSALNWEKIIDADPDVILIEGTAANPGDVTIDWIKKYKPAAQLKAVRNDKLISMPTTDFQAGLRTGAAFHELADALAR